MNVAYYELKLGSAFVNAFLFHFESINSKALSIVDTTPNLAGIRDTRLPFWGAGAGWTAPMAGGDITQSSSNSSVFGHALGSTFYLRLVLLFIVAD